ncbi:uncharacterized oxidoreductase YjmC-like [Episyrphus balteatus]|uniref:uncharacterized oxidoreductase YjmC-like n=1 Tax=Episyrphus balteatus TaxID=286459 RepID=UPI002485F3AE|nr:uncharacterized oxidoreductase YjmC-like [Episyrphus balteatus]
MSVHSQSKLVAVEESHRFMFDCFKAVHVPDDHARAMADLLIAADHRGHFSHGMNRLEMYLNDLAINSTNASAVPEIINETPATAWVDGKNGLGAVVGNYCMDLAIKKAKIVGVGWVCAKRSNHYGIAGWYSKRAMEHGMVGISMTNTSPAMAPTRSKEAALGTNPLAFGAPAKKDKFLLDMATTSVAMGKIEIQRRKGDSLPDGWAQDPEGKQTNDAELAYKTRCLMPLGGLELTIIENQKTDPLKPVLVPGDKEDAIMEAVNQSGGIQYLENQLKCCEELSKRLNVKPMEFIMK